MNAVLDQKTSQPDAGNRSGEPQRVRVSLREIRECTFRALSAHGASQGEASTAARMVVDAELQGYRGIRLVLSDLQRDPWPREGIQVSDSQQGLGGSVVLGDRASNRLLRHVPLAAHLAAAEPGRGVYVPGAMVGVACAEAALLEVAEATQRPAALVPVLPGGDGASRVALADGSLGTGMTKDLLERAGIHLDDTLDADTGSGGVWLFSYEDPSAHDAPDLTWVSASERMATRASAAHEGPLITATAWWALYAASRRYLVGS